MRFLTMCALGILALSAAAAASAQSRPAARQPSLFISPMGEAFRANATGARGIDLWLAEADTNYDTRISHDEFIANANAFFPHVDANQDGALTSSEDTAYWQAHAPEVVNGDPGGEPIGNTEEPPEAHHHNDSGPTVSHSPDMDLSGPHRARPMERAMGAQGYGLLGDVEPIMTCDTNFDRRVTLVEFDACAERRFAMLDLNHDGFITPDELNQFRPASGSDVIHVPR